MKYSANQIELIYEKVLGYYKKSNYTIWNFTITIDPKKMSLSESWKLDLTKIGHGIIKLEDIFYIISTEKHNNENKRRKNYFPHFHGQLIIPNYYIQTYNTFYEKERDLLIDIRRLFREKYGRCEIKLNYLQVEESFIKNQLGVQESTEELLQSTRDYTEYVLKDVILNQETMNHQFLTQNVLKISDSSLVESLSVVS